MSDLGDDVSPPKEQPSTSSWIRMPDENIPYQPDPESDVTTERGDLQENGFIKLNTHDTSFVEEHIPNIEQFAEDLQIAINAAWPTRHSSRYGEVYVMLLSWEDDNLGVEKEIRRLGYVFSNLYRFDVQQFKIPRKTPGRATSSRISTFLENDDSSNLLIVYYGGHAQLGHQSTEPPIWAATDKPGSPTLPSGGVQQLFEEAESDVLLLYDSCHSSHPAINVSGQGVTEVIAACGFETQAPAVGPHSFTNALIRELEEAFNGPPISVAEIHGRIIGSLKSWKPGLLRDPDGNVWTDANGKPRYECYKRRTPVHCFLTNETPYRSIMLAPLRSNLSHAAVATIEPEDTSSLHTPSPGQPSHSPSNSVLSPSTSTEPTTISESSKSAEPLEVLLAVRLEDDFFLDNEDGDRGDKIRTWCEWLKAMPRGVKNVSIQGLYKSCSALVIISVPLALWDLLPNNAAYSFIGFVSSSNLAPSLNMEKETGKVTLGLIGTSQSKLDGSWKDPIRVVILDSGVATGLTLTLPFDLCRTWDDTKKRIKKACCWIESSGTYKIKEKAELSQYELLDASTVNNILPSEWDSLVRPGWEILVDMWPMQRTKYQLGPVVFSPCRVSNIPPSLEPSIDSGFDGSHDEEEMCETGIIRRISGHISPRHRQRQAGRK